MDVAFYVGQKSSAAGFTEHKDLRPVFCPFLFPSRDTQHVLWEKEKEKNRNKIGRFKK
jgi:hypothetical protein